MQPHPTQLTRLNLPNKPNLTKKSTKLNLPNIAYKSTAAKNVPYNQIYPTSKSATQTYCLLLAIHFLAILAYINVVTLKKNKKSIRLRPYINRPVYTGNVRKYSFSALSSYEILVESVQKARDKMFTSHHTVTL